jgi:hypothetical protein
MRQSNYDTIIACIRVGAPAIQEGLINDLNGEIELANQFRQLKHEQEQEASVLEAARQKRRSNKAEVQEEPKE